MKAENLKIMQKYGINVPKFITVTKNEKIDLSFSKCDKFAVRSSFDVEDSEENSFAGQFETYLNLDKKDIKNKVNAVFESYKRSAIKEYHDIKTSNGQVIIQEMVESELSGVLFTANPMGILNEFTIVIGRGLGLNIVEDKINTTTYNYNVDDNMYDFVKTGNSPVISDKMLNKLVKNGKQIEKIFGKKMDIEFAVKNETLYILQAREITTIKYKNIIVLDNSNIVESYPGVSLPLTQSFVKNVYYLIFKHLLLRLSKDKSLAEKMDFVLLNMVDTANGRLYYRIENWYSLLKLLPLNKKIIEVWQSMLGVQNTEITAYNFKITLKNKLKINLNLCINFLNCNNKMQKIDTFFQKINKTNYESLKELETDKNYRSSILSKIKLLENLKSEIISKWDITLINDLYTFIFTALSGKKNQSALSEIKNLESLKPIIELNKLKKCDENKAEYKVLFNSYIEKYGDRCLEELKMETRTYRTNPEILKEYLKSYSAVEKEEPKNKHDGFFIKKAKQGIRNREISRMNRSRLFGIARAIYLSIGEDLFENNLIENQRDVFYLYENELLNFDLNFKKIIAERKAEFEIYKKIPNYSRLVFIDKIINKNFNLNYSVSIEKNIIKGTGTSEGIAEGEILIIDSPNLNIDTENKIIVTKMTDPGWIYLIKNARGIISEQGSILSHTAIISRELKKPAVVNVKHAGTLFKNGEKVRINGLLGTIERISK